MTTKPKARLLYVEDKRGPLRSIRQRLRRRGFAVTHTADGADGVDRMRYGTFDIVLIGRYLADMAGIDALRSFVDLDHGTPIVVACNEGDAPAAERILQAGASACVPSDGGDGYAALLVATVERTYEARILEPASRGAEAELAARTDLFKNVLANLDEGLCVFDQDLRLMSWNDRYAELYEFPKRLFKMRTPLESFFRFNAERGEYGDMPSEATIADRLERARSRETHIYEHARPNGTIIEVRGNPMPDGGFLSTHTDITERKQAEEAAQLAMTVFDTAMEAVVVMDPRRRIVSVNPAFTMITGYEPDDVIGRDVNMLDAGRHDADFYDEIFDILSSTGRWQGEIWSRGKFGDSAPQWWSMSAIRDTEQHVSKFAAIFRDISQRKKDEETIIRQATFDALTNLPNRSLFVDRLSQAIESSRRSKQRMALMFIDLDRFKKINDTLGHNAGDQVLRESADRLVSCLRKTDTAARLGGDEFTAILPGVREVRYAERVARKILARLAEPFILDNAETFISGSIGITIYPDDGEDEETLLKNADVAMYQSKEDGRNAYCFFTQDMNAASLELISLEGDLRRAIDNDEFVLHYQPIVDINSGVVDGTEALLRWVPPNRDMVSPATFIPLAEDTGLIVPIGEWVLRSALRQADRWRAEDMPPLSVAVNLSSRQCRDARFAETLRDTLDEIGVDPSAITLEITESLLMESGDVDPEAVLHDYRSLGVHLSLDDFGTGYSSLSYLKRFPVDVLKIDRSFITDIDRDDEAKALVDAIISMAHGIDIKVVAEGVENEDQFNALAAMGCDRMQGYYISPPLAADEFAAFVRARVAA